MNNKKVNLFYMGVHWGGAAAYTCHMVMAFRKMGYDVQLLKISPLGEKVTRLFGDNIYHDGTDYSYDNIRYRNISIQDALREIEDAKYNHIACALYTGKTEETVNTLLNAGCSIMIHGPVESNKKVNDRIFTDIVHDHGIIPIVPRTSMASFVDGHFIPYPYNISIQKGNEVPFGNRPFAAMSGARLSQLKSSEILFDVNEDVIQSELDFQRREHPGFGDERIPAIETMDKHAIHLYGSFEKSRTASLSKKYGYENLPDGIPFFKGNYGLGKGPAIMSDYNFVVDLSNYIVNGETTGSGDISNFAMLEAYDAGSILIVHKSWVDAGIGLFHSMNCIVIETADELYDVISHPVDKHMDDLGNYQSQRKAYLKRIHSPEIVVPKYIDFWENM